MKKLLLMAAVLVLAACGEKKAARLRPPRPPARWPPRPIPAWAECRTTPA